MKPLYESKTIFFRFLLEEAIGEEAICRFDNALSLNLKDTEIHATLFIIEDLFIHSEIGLDITYPIPTDIIEGLIDIRRNGEIDNSIKFFKNTVESTCTDLGHVISSFQFTDRYDGEWFKVASFPTVSKS